MFSTCRRKYWLSPRYLKVDSENFCWCSSFCDFFSSSNLSSMLYHKPHIPLIAEIWRWSRKSSIVKLQIRYSCQCPHSSLQPKASTKVHGRHHLPLLCLGVLGVNFMSDFIQQASWIKRASWKVTYDDVMSFFLTQRMARGMQGVTKRKTMDVGEDQRAYQSWSSNRGRILKRKTHSLRGWQWQGASGTTARRAHTFTFVPWRICAKGERHLLPARIAIPRTRGWSLILFPFPSLSLLRCAPRPFLNCLLLKATVRT